jgi:quercetin dioxygenase-like cupin family protein
MSREGTWEQVVPADIIEWDRIEPKTVIPGFHGRFAHSKHMTFVLWEIDAGAILPEHSHMHEQVVHVHQGELEVTIDGRTMVLRAGSIGIIPPNAVHAGRALTDCRVMDAFYPLREDYMKDGTPSLLQAASKRAE